MIPIPALSLSLPRLLATLLLVSAAACGGGGGATATTGSTGFSSGSPAGSGPGSATATGSSTGHASASGGVGTTGHSTTSGVAATSGGLTTGNSTGSSCPGQGNSCTPSNVCDLGVIECAGGSPFCQDQGPNAGKNGVTCGPAAVCNGGSCNPCTPNVYCLPTNTCDKGTTECSSGSSVCLDDGSDPGQNGQSCGGGGICANGSCATCTSGASCRPANTCDLGTIVCSGGTSQCQDQGPDATQNGVSCGPNLVCSGGQCNPVTQNDGGLSWPIIPNGGNGVVAAPALILITYSGDPNTAALQGYVQWLATGGYLAQVGAEYGVGNGTVIKNVVFSDTPPANPNAVDAYLQGHLTDGSLPPSTSNSIYILAAPNSSPSTTSFCGNTAGYHTYGQSGYLYAVTPDCTNSVQQVEVTISHEVMEAATDPFVTTYQITDPNNPWTYLGGEVGDLCASNSYYVPDPTQTYSSQLFWSNAAAAAGAVPCVPWPANLTYLSVIAPTTMATAQAGGSAVITVTGWASAPFSGSWTLAAIDGDYQVDFATTPVVSGPITQGGTATITLNVPSTATPGQHGAAWVICQDASLGSSLGSAMVGVTVQ